MCATEILPTEVGPSWRIRYEEANPICRVTRDISNGHALLIAGNNGRAIWGEGGRTTKLHHVKTNVNLLVAYLITVHKGRISTT